MFGEDRPNGQHAEQIDQNDGQDKRGVFFLKDNGDGQKNEEYEHSHEKSKGWNRAVGTCEYTGEVGQQYWNQRAMDDWIVHNYTSKTAAWQKVGIGLGVGVMGKFIKVFTGSETARPVPVSEKYCK